MTRKMTRDKDNGKGKGQWQVERIRTRGNMRDKGHGEMQGTRTK